MVGRAARHTQPFISLGNYMEIVLSDKRGNRLSTGTCSTLEESWRQYEGLGNVIG
ncbi:MAG: hypothetical protein NPIRA05_18730 [Nitrospirales bacterium]|nr:MAG: hypothetical protein NPIRA05_18730 [Nitrospirales bacterium]